MVDKPEQKRAAVPAQAKLGLPHRYCDVCHDVKKVLQQCTGGCPREICTDCCNKPDAKPLCVLHGYPTACLPPSRAVVGASLRMLDRQRNWLRVKHVHAKGLSCVSNLLTFADAKFAVPLEPPHEFSAGHEIHDYPLARAFIKVRAIAFAYRLRDPSDRLWFTFVVCRWSRCTAFRSRSARICSRTMTARSILSTPRTVRVFGATVLCKR
jgi:hypothetical protein